MKLIIKKRKSIIFTVLILAGVLSYIFSRSSCAGGLVPCTDDCNLCYLLVGISNIFLYLAGSLLMAAVLLGIVIGGMAYMVAGLFPQALNFAKLAFSVSLKAFVIFLCGWLAINSIMNIVGYKHPLGGKWWQFDCAGNANTQVASTSSNTGNANNANNTNNANNASNSSNDSANAPAKSTVCDPKNKKLESIIIQCAEQKETLADNGSGFFVALDTISEDEKGKTKQLKAIGKYSCDGTTSEEDITAQAEWKASDETQIKVAKGLVQAVAKNMTSESVPYVEAKFQEKNSNQAKVYINSCPNTKTAETKMEKNFSFSENSLKIPKASAQVLGKPTFNNEGCVSCGKNNTCHFVDGNPSANFIFILVRSNSTSERLRECIFSQTDWEAKDAEFIEPPDVALLAVSEAKQHLPEFDSKFAIYYSSEILDVGEKDENCPEAKFSSYGYVFNGTGGGASAHFGAEARYCIDTFTKRTNTFIHEQGGHAFGHLDDEYSASDAGGTARDYRDYVRDSFHYILNCTPDKNCPKWKKLGLSQECLQGCFYSDTEFYKSSEMSLMRINDIATGFGAVNEYILKYWTDWWPKGPYTELGDLISPTKGTIEINY